MTKERVVKFDRVHSGQAAAQQQARLLKYQQGVQGPLGMRRRERRRQP